MHKASFLLLLLVITITAIAVYETTVTQNSSDAFINFLGLDAFIVLCVSLIIGPLVVLNHKEFVALIEPRRGIGLAAFVLMIGHITLAISEYYSYDISFMLTQTPLIISSIAAILMTIVAITSCDYAMRKLGGDLWKNIQRLNYLIFIFAFAHFLLEIKGVSMNGIVGANLAEIFAILLGIATIILQVVGYMTRKKREKEAKEKMTQKKPEVKIEPQVSVQV